MKEQVGPFRSPWYASKGNPYRETQISNKDLVFCFGAAMNNSTKSDIGLLNPFDLTTVRGPNRFGQLNVNGSATGLIDLPADHDWFKME